MKEKRRIEEFLQGVRHAAIAGHVNPDGDCIGSCMGMYLYLRDNYPDIRVDVYLEEVRDVFRFISGLEDVRGSLAPDASCDLLILLDISSRDRIGVAGPLVEKAGKTLCIDHHVTNTGGYTWFFNEPQASSASEIVWHFLDEDGIRPDCAAALYTGIVHDTGVFQYSSTSPETMRIAAKLMEKGIPFSRIIDETFFQKSYRQNRAAGRVLADSQLCYGGQLIMGCLSAREMEQYGVRPIDMDGIVAMLRNTIGTEAAAFLYERAPGEIKVSLRSKERADVSKIAQAFGGGGHVRASGCTISGTLEEAEARIRDSFADCFAEDGAEREAEPRDR